MAAPTPARVLAAVKASGVRYVLEDGWDDPGIGKYGDRWQPVGVVLHHTANGGAKGNTPALRWVLHNEYAPVRACHFLVGRDGTVRVIYSLGCYHAGMGGPLNVGGVSVPKDAGNRYFYGIEIESKGTKVHVNAGPDDVDGFTPLQVAAVSALTAELLKMLGKGTDAVIRHRDWAPNRKTDVLQPLSFWRGEISKRLAPAPKPPAPTPAPARPAVRLSLVKPGATNADVKAVQKALRMPTRLQTGHYGPITRARVALLWPSSKGTVTRAILERLGFVVKP